MWLKVFVLVVTLGCASGAPFAHARVVPSAKAEPQKGPAVKLTIYLLFEGDCRQAMEFYRTVFGGELAMTTVGASPMKGMFPASMQERVVNARLVSATVDVSASDWLRPVEKPMRGNTVSLYLSGGTPGETKALFEALSPGAEVTDPLTEQPFGFYGALTDKFGIRWRFHAERM
jgi:PhnB protein